MRRHAMGRYPLVPVLLLAALLGVGCSSETSAPSQSNTVLPTITPTNYRIVFPEGTWSAIIFDHKHHAVAATHQAQNCYQCHNCADFTNDDRWNCRECHKPGDKPPGGGDSYHGYIMAQCSFCHERKRGVGGANPPLAKTCVACHTAGALLSPPVAGAPAIAFSGAITSASQVDQWPFSLAGKSDLILDVEAWEGCNRPPNYVKFPRDFFGNGIANDQLKSNIYLFSLPGMSVVDSRTAYYPGDTAYFSSAHFIRSARNPYLKRPGVPAGSYLVVIGASPLSAQDARNGNNTGGMDWDNRTSWDGTNYNHYRIKLYYSAAP